MKIAVIGTGMVGRVLAGRLADAGYDVVVGTRDVKETLARTEPDREQALRYLPLELENSERLFMVDLCLPLNQSIGPTIRIPAMVAAPPIPGHTT